MFLSPIYISESRISFAPHLFSLWWVLLTITLASSTLKISPIFFLGSREYSLDCSDVFVTRTLFSMPPVIRGCGSVPGSWAPRCCRHNFIVAVLEYLSFADIKNLFYAVVGEITSTPPSTGAGVREYCHNSYNGCFSKVEVHDFRRFLGYVLTDGYSWI